MTDRPEVDGVVAAASRALATTWTADVSLRLQDPIRDRWGRHTLVLCNVVDGPADGPRTVVVKAAVDRDGAIFNEWAVLDWLNQLDDVAHLVPALHAGDVDAQLIVLEDLGPGPLLRRLVHTRPDWAGEALVESMQLLGLVHAATRGRRAELDEVRDGLPAGPPPPEIGTDSGELITEMEAWGSVPPGVADEIATAAAAMRPALPFTSLTFHDACPPNRVVTTAGVRAVDLEMAGFRHPMIDGAYGVIGYLRCNDGLSIPPAIRRRMTAAYRAAVVAGYPEYDDTGRFHSDLAAAGVVWFVDLLRRFRGRADADRRMGFFGITARQRVHAALDALLAIAGTTGQLPQLSGWASDGKQRLEGAWGPVPELPIFPGLA